MEYFDTIIPLLLPSLISSPTTVTLNINIGWCLLSCDHVRDSMLRSHKYFISLIITILHVGTQGCERLNKFSVVTNVVIDRARIQIQVCLNPKPRYWTLKPCWLLNSITNEINMYYGCSWDFLHHLWCYFLN